MVKPKIRNLRSMLVERAVNEVCRTLHINPPITGHLLLSVIPYFTRLDFDALERDVHPLWCTSLNPKNVFGGSMYGFAEVTNRLKSTLSGRIAKGGDQQDCPLWDDFIYPRKFKMSEVAGAPVACDRDLVSPLLNKVEIQDMIDIQRLIHTIRMHGGPPKFINVTNNASCGVDVKITNLVNPVTDQLMESNYLGCDDPKQEWVNDFTSALRGSLPRWDFSANVPEYSGIQVEGKLENPAVGALLTNVLYYVYSGE